MVSMASCQLNDDKTVSNSYTMNIIIKFIKEIMLCNIIIKTSTFYVPYMISSGLTHLELMLLRCVNGQKIVVFRIKTATNPLKDVMDRDVNLLRILGKAK